MIDAGIIRRGLKMKFIYEWRLESLEKNQTLLTMYGETGCREKKLNYHIEYLRENMWIVQKLMESYDIP